MVFMKMDRIDLDKVHTKASRQIGRIFHSILKFKGTRARLPLHCTTDGNAMVVISLKPQTSLKFAKH
jgi:hypothetical protein